MIHDTEMPCIVSSSKLPEHFIIPPNSVRCRREDEKRTQDPALNSNDYDLGRGGTGKK